MSSGATVYIVFPELPCCLRLCTSQGTLTRTLIGSWDLFGIISIHSPIVLQAFPKTDVHAPLITFMSSIVLIHHLTLTIIPSQLMASLQHSPVI